MRIYDFSVVSAPELKSSLDLPDRWPADNLVGQFRIVVQDGLAYVPAWDNGFYVVDISDVSVPVVISQALIGQDVRCVQPFGDVAIIGGSIYIQGFLVDISDPSMPVMLQPLNMFPGGCFDCEVVDSVLYAATMQVFAIDLHNPYSPQVIDTFPLIASCVSLEAQGSYMFAANFHPTSPTFGVLSYDITNPAEVQFVGRYGGEGYDFDLTVVNDRAWVASHPFGLYILDESDLSAPSVNWCYATDSPGSCIGPGFSYQTFGITVYDSVALRSESYAGVLVYPLDARGDVSADGAVTSTDIIHLVNVVFKSGAPPADPVESDINCDDELTAADVILLVNYVFKGADVPVCP